MKQDFTYIFLTCSLLLILGHSILPHDHVQKKHAACEISTEKALSLSDIIKLALAHDIGANHLEEFNSCQPLECTLKSVEDNTCMLKIDFIDMAILSLATEVYLLKEPSYFTEHFFRHQSLRAPPSLS